jgi:leucyl-tRNA synthetase
MTKGTVNPGTAKKRGRTPTGRGRPSADGTAVARTSRAERGTAQARRAYDVAAVEQHWRDEWERRGTYQVDLERAPRPYYNLMMFPYPSAEGLHVGNMYSYVGSDIHGRWQAMNGNDVFEPMGFDAFGMHSENFAIKHGGHPRPMTEANIANFRRQLRRIGNRFDWSHEISTTSPEYYRWTQWIFVQLFKAGLAERRTGTVNWCPHDKTVLADEQVIAGHCERCHALVERRELPQWYFKITKYADRLLEHLDWLDWSERVKTAQRNWIGRSTGAEFTMRVEGHDDITIGVFTTRPDTIYGVTFVVVAPAHPSVTAIATVAQRSAVESYVATARRDAARRDPAIQRPVSGVFSGAFAIHPLTGERLPIWISDYVLMEYGTGAIMAVPAHDERDFAFARAFGLPIRPVVVPVGAPEAQTEGSAAPSPRKQEELVAEIPFTNPGALIDSGPFTGMTSQQAKAAIIAELEARGIGRRAATYHLRDWAISRQRYWGPPIPIIWCPEHGAVPVPEEQLPVLLPKVADYQPDGSGDSPLARVASFVQTTCPVCGGPARRETDVSDNFLDSAWYFLRYPSSDDSQEPWNPRVTRKWLPASMYIGGAEHSVLHLLYVRFITMALHDLGHLEFEEPFPHFRANGTILKDGAKISKSRGNVVVPDTYIARDGADVFRVYLVFMAPYEAGGDFRESGLEGVRRFLDRVWHVVTTRAAAARRMAPSDEARRALHSTIQAVTADIAALKYNTAVAALMKDLNRLERQPHVTREELRTFLLLLAPFAPFITEELWQRVGEKGSIHAQHWPIADASALRVETVTIVVQVNGRLRDRLMVAAEMSEAEITARALAAPNAARYVSGRAPRQIVYVPGRLVNIVVGE